MRDIRFLRKELMMRDLEIQGMEKESEIREKLNQIIIEEYDSEFNHIYMMNHDDYDFESYDDYINRLIDMIMDKEISLSEIF